MNYKYKLAAAHLNQGGVLAYPTEAVWGLGCDAFNEDAVRHLLRLKQRPESKGLILVTHSLDYIKPLLAPLTPDQLSRCTLSWPGPTTWILPDPLGLIPTWIKGDHDQVAVRVSAHPGVRGLCAAFGHFLVSTSANRAGAQPLKYSWNIKKAFGDSVHICAGQLGKLKRPTPIIDVISGEVIRSA